MIAMKWRASLSETLGPDVYQALRRYASRLLRDEAEAEDVLQEALIKLTQQEKREEVRDPAAWLYRAIRNQAMDILRRRKTFQKIHDTLTVQAEGDTHEARHNPAQQLEQSEMTELLLANLRTLPERQQEAIRLKFQEKMTYHQIAFVMGESRSTVGWLLHEAIANLRKLMSPKEPLENERGNQ